MVLMLSPFKLFKMIDLDLPSRSQWPYMLKSLNVGWNCLTNFNQTYQEWSFGEALSNLWKLTLTFATAAIFKILLLLLLRNYCTDFNQISHTGSWWCLVVPNQIQTDPTKLAGMAAIYKILLSLLLRNYSRMDFNQIWHACFLWCLVAPNWNSNRSDDV